MGRKIHRPEPVGGVSGGATRRAKRRLFRSRAEERRKVLHELKIVGAEATEEEERQPEDCGHSILGGGPRHPPCAALLPDSDPPSEPQLELSRTQRDILYKPTRRQDSSQAASTDSPLPLALRSASTAVWRVSLSSWPWADS